MGLHFNDASSQYATVTNYAGINGDAVHVAFTIKATAANMSDWAGIILKGSDENGTPAWCLNK